MSQENLEVARGAYQAFNAGDLEAVSASFDPDIHWQASDVFFDEPRTYRGRRAWRDEFLADLLEIFTSYQANPERLIDTGDAVVAIVYLTGRGRQSGADVTARVAHVMTFAGGRVASFTELKDVDEALAAAGVGD